MATKQEQIVKDLVNHGGQKVHNYASNGDAVLLDRNRDNLTSTGFRVDSEGKIKKL